MNVSQDLLVKFKNWRQESAFRNLLNLFFLTITFLGAFTSIYMNVVNRSFWLDESLLAYSFSRRTIFNLWDGAFENAQAAPLGWLYVEKLLTVIFGNTEFVVRIGSVAGFLLTLWLLYYFMKTCFHTAYPLAACGFYANMPFILKYANVFKPYICDGFFVLLVILLFHVYKQGRIGYKRLSAGWMILIWFSNPTCFFEGGLLLSEAVFVIYDKNWKKLKELIISGAAIVISFVIYYFFWLREVANSDVMQDFWAGHDLPLIPTSLADLVKIKELLLGVFLNFGPLLYLFIAMLAVTFVIAIKKKDGLLIGCYIGLLITCFASYIGMFPVEDRLWCFLYALAVLLCFIGMDALIGDTTKTGLYAFGILVLVLVYSNTENLTYSCLAFLCIFALCELISKEMFVKIRSVAIGLLLFLLVTSNSGIMYYLHADNVYWDGQELNDEVAYLKENLEEDEFVYVYSFSQCGFQYKNGYGSYSIGEYKDNVIFGTGTFEAGRDCTAELERILSHDKVYIVSSHVWTREYLQQLLDAAHTNGYFQLILFEHGTPLWFYCDQIEDSKVRASYEVLEISESGSKIRVTVRIHNIGEAYINHMYETVCFANCEDHTNVDLEKMIEPGGYTDVTVEYEKGTNPDFRLENEYGLVSPDSVLHMEEAVGK